MAANVSLSQAAVWSHLQGQISPNDSTPSHQDTLAPVTPSGRAWSDFISTGTGPYVQHLSQSLQGISQFIEQHAQQGPQKQAALGMLRDFESTRVKCRAESLNPLMVNENRRNLHLIANQLNNEAIPLQHRVGVAINLAQGLNVCVEGTSLNILNSASELCNQQTGLAGQIINTKNTLLEQHLLSLVKQQDRQHLRHSLAEILEIHHVQALKNHVASQWGLPVIADRHATSQYQQQAGEMASAMLKKTITPKALAATVAQNLACQLCSLTDDSLASGMPSDQLKTEPLRQVIQAEFGTSIELHECLEFNEDYSMVKLKSEADLTSHVLHAFKDIGLIPADASIDALANETICPVDLAIEQVKSLQGRVSARSRDESNLFQPTFWLGHIELNHQKRDEEERWKLVQGSPGNVT